MIFSCVDEDTCQTNSFIDQKGKAVKAGRATGSTREMYTCLLNLVFCQVSALPQARDVSHDDYVDVSSHLSLSRVPAQRGYG